MYLCAGALTYLFTYLHSWLRAYKTGNICETVKDRAKVTITAYIVHGLSIAAKMYDLDLCTRFNVIDSLNAAKMAKNSF